MGTIQQSINSMLSSTAQVLGIHRAAKEMHRANELRDIEGKKGVIDEQEKVLGEYQDIDSANKATNRHFKEAKSEHEEALDEYNRAQNWGNEMVGQGPSARDIEDLAGKAMQSEDNLKEMQRLKKAQNQAFRERKAQLQQRLDLINEKANMYGVPETTLKGGKK